MTWLGYIAISTFAYSFAVIVQRVLVQENKEHPIAFIAIYQMIVGFLVLLFGWVQGDLSFSSKVIGEVGLFILIACLLYAGANFCIFSALQRIQASRFTIAFSSRMFFTLLVAWLFLGEAMNFGQIIGAVVLFIGIIIANYMNITTALDKRGIFYAVLGALFFGIANVSDRFILQSMELYSYVSISFIGTSLIFVVTQPKELFAGRLLLRIRPLMRIVLLSVLYAVSSLTFFAALQLGDSASQVVSVSLVSVIVTVLFAMIFLKEREHPYQKILGAVLSFIGVLLLV